MRVVLKRRFGDSIAFVAVLEFQKLGFAHLHLLEQLHPLLEKLGIPLGGFHSMRHGVASPLLADGATPAVVQKQGTVTHGLLWGSADTWLPISSAMLLRIALHALRSSR
jgi:hypothetical protein